MLADPRIAVTFSDHELLQTGGRTQYPDRVFSDNLARSGFAAPTVMMRRSALVPLWQSGLSVPAVLRQLSRSGWQVARHATPILLRSDTERPLCIVHAATEADAHRAAVEIRAAFTIGDEAPPKAPVVRRRVGPDKPLDQT